MIQDYAWLEYAVAKKQAEKALKTERTNKPPVSRQEKAYEIFGKKSLLRA